MVSRREVISAGVLGTLSPGVPENAAAATQDMTSVSRSLNDIKAEVEDLNELFGRYMGNSMSIGLVGDVRGKIEQYLKTSGKFPEFLEVGTTVFYDVYDWHVRYQQQIQVTQLSDQRMMIKFMFTQLILRWEQASNYIGAPYDRG